MTILTNLKMKIYGKVSQMLTVKENTFIVP